MQRGFVRYIQLGPRYNEVPAGIMGGVIHNPILLFYHFFAVALYSMGLYLLSQSIYRLHVSLFHCVSVFSKAVGIIWPYILSEFRV